jgi:hypothetical protein
MESPFTAWIKIKTLPVKLAELHHPAQDYYFLKRDIRNDRRRSPGCEHISEEKKAQSNQYSSMEIVKSVQETHDTTFQRKHFGKFSETT